MVFVGIRAGRLHRIAVLAFVSSRVDSFFWRFVAVSTPMAPIEEQLRVLKSGVAELHPRDGLDERLAAATAEGRPLRVKLGIDPSSSHLTLGHAVVLRKLAQFQRFGHTVVLIIGNFTGLVGDPSGRSQTRRQQSESEVADYARTYLEQVDKVLDTRAAEVRWNAEWLAPMTFADVARLAAHVTVAKLLERDDFRARYTAGQPISLVEFLYPLMQGMDSVAIRSDVELGGTDQTFNLHVGRDLQRANGQPGQVVLTMPLLRGIDGVQKMSKSLDNGIYLDEPPQAQFGKLMRVPDEVLPEYLRLGTDLDPAEVDRLAAQAAAGGAGARDVKRRLAHEVVALYHGPEAADAAEAAFDAGVRLRAGGGAGADAGSATPLAIPEAAVGDGRVWVVALLAEAGLVGSRSEARRLVTQGAVRLDGQPVDSIERSWPPAELDGRLLTVGRRTPVRLRAPDGPGGS
jgi:tyrosyl-tRNA synthetase